MKAKILFLSACITAFLLILSCTKANSVQSKEITLVMAEANPEGTISAEMDKAFKKKVEELSGGKIKIELHFTSNLGDEQTIMDYMTKPGSSIQLERISAFNLSPYGCYKSSLLAIPYTFSNHEHFWKFAESKEADEILTEPYEKKVGLRGLFFGEEGFRHFFATKPIYETKDFKRIKLRTTSDPIMQGIATGLGAEPVSVAFADLFSALQTGVADAAEQPIANYLANHFNKIAPYMILDGHTLGVTEVIISSEAWDSLSEHQKKILTEAGRYAMEICKKISQDAEIEAKKQLVKDGTIFVEITNPAPWKKSCEGIISEYKKIAPHLYQKILWHAN